MNFYWLFVITCVTAEYRIIDQDSISKYDVIAEHVTTTLTECWMKCANEIKCRLVGMKEKEYSQKQCLLLREKVPKKGCSNSVKKDENETVTILRSMNQHNLLHQLVNTDNQSKNHAFSNAKLYKTSIPFWTDWSRPGCKIIGTSCKEEQKRNCTTIDGELIAKANCIGDDFRTVDCDKAKCFGHVQCNLASGDGEGADEFHASSTAQGQDCLALCYARSLTQKNINGMTTHPSEGCYCEIGMTKIASSNSYMSCFFVISSWSAWTQPGCQFSNNACREIRTRSCLANGQPQTNCPGDATMTITCEMKECATWSAWSHPGCKIIGNRSCKEEQKRNCTTGDGELVAKTNCIGDEQQTVDCDQDKCFGHVQCNLASGDGRGYDEIHYSSTAQGQDCLELCYARSLTKKNINGMTTHPSKGCYCEIGMTSIASHNTYKSCYFVISSWSAWTKPGCQFSNNACQEIRTRSCLANNQPQTNCPGDATMTISCEMKECVTWSDWSRPGCKFVGKLCQEEQKRNCTTNDGNPVASTHCTGDDKRTVGCDKSKCLERVLCNLVSGDGQGESEEYVSLSLQGRACIEHCYQLKVDSIPTINGVTTHPTEGCYCEKVMYKIASHSAYKSCFLSTPWDD